MTSDLPKYSTFKVISHADHSAEAAFALWAIVHILLKHYGPQPITGYG
jgi:hypothetical protein